MKTLCCIYSSISPMHISRTFSFLDKDQTPVKTRKHGERHLYQTHLTLDSDLLQLHRKGQNIPKYRGTALFTQNLLISYSGTSQSPFIYTILKKIWHQ